MIGRGGKTGIATTLITPSQPELVLKDLKHLLVEAKQKVPEFLSFATKSRLLLIIIILILEKFILNYAIIKY